MAKSTPKAFIHYITKAEIFVFCIRAIDIGEDSILSGYGLFNIRLTSCYWLLPNAIWFLTQLAEILKKLRALYMRGKSRPLLMYLFSQKLFWLQSFG